LQNVLTVLSIYLYKSIVFYAEVNIGFGCVYLYAGPKY